MSLLYPPLVNGLQRSLSAQLDEGATASATFNNTTGLQNKAGVFVVDRIDTDGNEKDPSVREYIAYTGTSGSTVVTLTRGLGGSTDQDHAVGAVVEFVADVTWAQALLDTYVTEHNDDGTHSDITADSVTTDSVTAKTVNGDLEIAGNGTGKVKIDSKYGDITSNTDGATITFDLATSNLHTVTLGDNRTLALSNVSVGQCFIIRLVQDGTGSRTVTWFSTIKWAGGSAPTLTTTLNKTDVFGFLCTGSGTYDGFIVGQNL